MGKIEIKVYDNYLKGKPLHVETIERVPFNKNFYGLCCRYKGGIFMIQKEQQVAYIYRDLELPLFN